RIDQSLRTPQKHSAVPKIIARLQEIRCTRAVGLFGEPSNSQRFLMQSIARLDISIACFWPGWLDAQHHDVGACCRNLNSALDDFAVRLLVTDDMIRGKKTDHGIEILSMQ